MMSVVVATYNRRDTLALCLKSLADQDCPASQYEVIVVVDGSNDGTQEFLGALSFGPNLKVIDQPNRGLAAARNAGLRAARNELVLFLDDDLICSPQVLTEHLRAHQSDDKLLAFGPVLVKAPTEGVASRVTRQYYAESIYGPFERGETSVWPTHVRVPPNSSISRELLLSFGGFDERFVNAHEDVELGIRLWKAGVQFRYISKADVEHIYSKSAKELARIEACRGGKFEVMLCRKHPAYRPISQLAAIQERLIFRTGVGDILLKFKAAAFIAGGILAIARKFRVKDELLLGLETNMNMLQCGILEVGSWKSFRAEFCMRLPVLLYRYIGGQNAAPHPDFSIDPGRFAVQMRWLADNGYTPISTADWLHWCESAKPLPAKPVLITFDDAYADLVNLAFPVLRDLRFRATVFVPTAYIGESNIWDQVSGTRLTRLMTSASICDWAAKGIEFGAHSRTHPHLETAGASSLQDEVEGSRADLERILQSPVTAFAYPYGTHNSAMEEVVQRNFHLAFTNEEGLNTLGTNPFQLRRIVVQPSYSLKDFASRLRFGMSLPKSAGASVRTFAQRARRRVL